MKSYIRSTNCTCNGYKTKPSKCWFANFIAGVKWSFPLLEIKPHNPPCENFHLINIMFCLFRCTVFGTNVKLIALTTNERSISTFKSDPSCIGWKNFEKRFKFIIINLFNLFGIFIISFVTK